MPGLKVAPPPETPFPGTSPRRRWAHPELRSHALLVLNFDRLYLAPSDGEFDAGNDLNELLDPSATVIDLADVRRLKLDLMSNTVVIEHSGEWLAVTFATPEAADACFARLWRQLGDGFSLAPYSRDTWSLVRGPLLLLLGVLAAVAVCVAALSVLEDAGPERPAVGFDWKTICAVGGVIAAASQVWLYRRLTTPPVALELVRS
jgi:hypothetical protein